MCIVNLLFHPTLDHTNVGSIFLINKLLFSVQVLPLHFQGYY